MRSIPSQTDTLPPMFAFDASSKSLRLNPAARPSPSSSSRCPARAMKL